MRVTFVLPGFRTRPVGGFLVVYRYANELARLGHRVSLVHPRLTTPAETAPDRVKAASWAHRKRLRYRGGRPPWFRLDSRVTVVLTPDLRASRIPDGDAIFATAYNTARNVWSYPAGKGAKLYLVQHFEDWVCGRNEVEATWKLRMHKVVSSKWLYEIGVGLGETERLTHIPYGVEHDVFRQIVPPRDRIPTRVGFLAHDLPWKGMRYGIEALEILRERHSGIEAVSFGARPRPPDLPAWMEYHENLNRGELARLYNSFAVFMHTSESEGWGLTGAEAVACGCALLAADSGGVRDYAIHGETALLVPTRDPSALAAALQQLIEYPRLRLQLASAGRQVVQQLTWERAAEALDAAIREVAR